MVEISIWLRCEQLKRWTLQSDQKARDLENLEHCIDFCEMGKFQIQEISDNK